ncbi:hypothetical protein [Cryptosporangium sp. NPDC051539]|uniref:hypothetical protein n=1 Tax=Cryptosporangium sp. NPDC051539 TaxID=3363962 RepID=UPI0037A22A16
MAEQASPTALSRLITEVMDHERLSAADIARRSEGEFNAGQLSKWRNRTFSEALRPATIVALAHALRRPPYEVWEAMGASLGIEPRSSSGGSRLSRALRDESYDLLTPSQEHLVVSMASEMVPKRTSSD